MTQTATYIRTVHEGDTSLQQRYILSDIGDVIVSQISSEHFGDETYIFPCNKDGDITDWTELSGSRKGKITPHDLLVELGYEVTQ